MKRNLPQPAYLNTLLLLEIGAHFVLRIKLVFRAPYSYLGLPLILVGLAGNVYTVGFLAKSHGTIDFFATSGRLVVGGSFRISRNPTCLSGVIPSLGIAVFLGSLVTLVVPTVLFVILNILCVPAEQLRLEKAFGKE